MDRIKKSWYEREEIEKVTLDWVKVNCHLTERELSLLKIINDRKLVKRNHLEVISDMYRGLGSSRTAILNRSIKKLFRKMVIDKVHEPKIYGKGNSPCIVSIDKGGALILDTPFKRRIIHKKEKYGSNIIIKRFLPSNYRHINGINGVEVETIMFCEDYDLDLSKWVLEKSHSFTYGNENIVLIPDIYTEIIAKDRSLRLFIEYDTGSENMRYKSHFPIIHDKLIKYKKYKASKLWTDEMDYFPLLLLVTEDDKRSDYFTLKSKELGLEGFGVFITNYRSFLDRLYELW